MHVPTAVETQVQCLLHLKVRKCTVLTWYMESMACR